MRVPDEVQKCVCFVGYRMHDGSEILSGSAFFVARTVGESETRFTYVATAKHVLNKIRDLGLDRAILRVNLRGSNEAISLDTNLSDWVTHIDEAVDVAVLPFVMHGLDHLYYPVEGSVSGSMFQVTDIGTGTEVFMAGLFTRLASHKRNVPIVRVGNISAMPEGKVMTDLGETTAYFIECRSIGGLSGSPVFAHPEPFRDDGTTFTVGQHSGYFLLGLIHGHFDLTEPAAKAVTEAEERINMGIALVTPVGRLLEVLGRPELVERDRQTDAAIRARQLPAPD
jgi:hypothetical protein